MMEPRGSQEWSATMVRRLRAGDAAAGSALESGLRPRLVAYARRFLPEEAEDLAQEALTRALTSDTEPERLRAWCFRVVRNLALNQLRDRRGAEALGSAAHALPLETLGPLTRLVQGEDHAQVAAQLARLSVAQREALTLRYVEGLGREEIATVLDLEVGQVKSRLYEGLARLRDLLD